MDPVAVSRLEEFADLVEILAVGTLESAIIAYVVIQLLVAISVALRLRVS